MHAVVPIVGMSLNLLQEMAEHSNRRKDGVPFVGMLGKRKHGFETAGLVSTGALVRDNPLPVGRYWIDVFDDALDTWGAWLATANLFNDPNSYTGPGPRVVVEKVEHYDADEESGAPGRSWTVFNVRAPVAWGKDYALVLGWPNTAPPSIQTSDDTVQKPDARDTLPWWQGGTQGGWDDLGTGWKIAIVGGAVLFISIVAFRVSR